jgi:hypothetical protein
MRLAVVPKVHWPLAMLEEFPNLFLRPRPRFADEDRERKFVQAVGTKLVCHNTPLISTTEKCEGQ